MHRTTCENRPWGFDYFSAHRDSADEELFTADKENALYRNTFVRRTGKRPVMLVPVQRRTLSRLLLQHALAG